MRRIHHAIAAALGVRAARLSIPRPLADLVAIANDAFTPKAKERGFSIRVFNLRIGNIR